MGRCALCETDAELRNSHIVPRFVFKYLTDTSPGLLRFGENPNLRVQDGTKIKLLCHECEQLFSEWEREFAQRVFIPFHKKNPTEFMQYAYGPWGMKFVASVAWRTVQLFRRSGEDMDHLSEERLAKLLAAEDAWRALMLGERERPGDFELHVYQLPPPVGLPEGVEHSKYLSRYLSRSVDLDIPASTEEVFVYAKLAELTLLGFVESRRFREWHGGRLRPKTGLIGSRNLAFPLAFWEYVNYRAGQSGEAFSSLSDRQRQKIDEIARKDLDATQESPAFQALASDVFLFGPAQVFARSDGEDE